METVGGLLAKALGRVPIAGRRGRGARPAAVAEQLPGPAQPHRHLLARLADEPAADDTDDDGPRGRKDKDAALRGDRNEE